MACCGLIAFLLAQPLLLWRGIKSWFGGAPFHAAFQLHSPWGLKMAAGMVAAELALFAMGAMLTLQLGGAQFAAAQMFPPLGKICSMFGHQTR